MSTATAASASLNGAQRAWLVKIAAALKVPLKSPAGGEIPLTGIRPKEDELPKGGAQAGPTKGPASAADPNAAKYQKEVLKVGSKGPAIEYLQKTLGGSIKIDGKFGPGTQKAVQAFQTSKGLKADGIVGPKTWAALGGGAGAGTSSAAKTGTSASAPAKGATGF